MPIKWTQLRDYPDACSVGSYITKLDDTITCTAIASIPNNMTAQDINPITNALYSLGNSTLRWLKGWFVDLDVSGTADLNNANINGTIKVKGTSTYTGTCANITYNEGIAISCND